MTAPDVAVIGGGAIGLAVAWTVAAGGLSVEVMDPAPGGGASHVAAGMLAPVTEVHYGEETLLHLNLASARQYPEFVARLEDAAGRPVSYRTCGTLAVAGDNDDLAALAEVTDYQLRLGLKAQRLTSRECRRLEPSLSPSVRGGALVAGDHQVDPRALVAALLAACASAGVRVTRESVADVGVAGDRATGVTLRSGERRAAGAVVLAAGARSSSIGGLPPGAVPPVRPVKGQLLRLRGPAERPVLTRNVRATVAGSGVYLVPRADGEMVVGATVEEKGHDATVTAGAVYGLLRDAVAVVPEVGELALAEASAGSRPGSPDNAPLIGATDVGGLVLATGHYRNGILLTPVTAGAIAALLLDGAVPDVAAPFAPTRFRAAP